jgi:hypothetical protein
MQHNIMEMAITRKRRSVQLTREEHSAFKKHYNSFPTKVDAEAAFGLSRQVLDLVAIKGSGSQETIDKVRDRLASIAQNP